MSKWPIETFNALLEMIGNHIESKYPTGSHSPSFSVVCLANVYATRIVTKLTSWLDQSNRLREEGIFRVCGNAGSLYKVVDCV